MLADGPRYDTDGDDEETVAITEDNAAAIAAMLNNSQ